MKVRGLASRFTLVGSALAAVGLLATAYAHSGTPTSGVVHSCVKGGTGQLRIIAETDQCKEQESALDWNIQGTAGPQGPQGVQGPAGPQGPSPQIVTQTCGSFGTTSLTYTDVTGCAVDISVDQPSNLVIHFAGSHFLYVANANLGTQASASMTVSVNGVDQVSVFEQEYATHVGPINDPLKAPASFSLPVSVEAGSHNVKLRIRMVNVHGPYEFQTGIGYNGIASTLSVMAFPKPSGS